MIATRRREMDRVEDIPRKSAAVARELLTVAVTSEMKGNLFGNGQCRAPPLVIGRRLPRDFSSWLITRGFETSLNDSWVDLCIRTPRERRRNSMEDYIAHRRPPFFRVPTGSRIQRNVGRGV
jgi:hypothetical protein